MLLPSPPGRRAGDEGMAGGEVLAGHERFSLLPLGEGLGMRVWLGMRSWPGMRAWAGGEVLSVTIASVFKLPIAPYRCIANT